MAKVDELTVEVKANITIPTETAERCIALLNMWLEDNPDTVIRMNEQKRKVYYYYRLGEENNEIHNRD